MRTSLTFLLRGTWILALSALALVLTTSPAFAIKQCKLSRDPGTGVYRLKAKSVVGSLAWGTRSGESPYGFSNDPACRKGKKAKDCLFDDDATPFDPAFPPPTCQFVVRDNTAQQCALTVPDCEVRFEDCGDGTVADHRTGLLWEEKTGTVGIEVMCESLGCPDPHHVNNRYEWSNTGTDPNGNVYTDFLARLNADADPDAATGCFSNHCDWRLPTIGEFQAIMIGPEAAPGQAASCDAPPCIDPGFAAAGGSTASADCWSMTTLPDSPGLAWDAGFDNGFVATNGKSGDNCARAVRAGSCTR